MASILMYCMCWAGWDEAVWSTVDTNPGSVSLVAEQMTVQTNRDVVIKVLQDDSLKVLHNYRVRATGR